MRRRTKSITKYWAGIDPGKTGGICVLDEKDSSCYFPWPKDDNYADMAEILMLLNKPLQSAPILNPPQFVMLERVHAMPKQGVSSCFTFGSNFGAWKMALAMLQWSHYLPTPQEWQKGVGIKKSDGKDTKERAYNVARRLFPHAILKGPRGGIISGYADSLLLAHYARLTHNKRFLS